MEVSAQQQKRREEAAADEKGPQVQLPTESSPYVRYTDLEDYKMQGYGAQGRQQLIDKPGGGGGTDGPTVSGSGLTERQAHATDGINHQGVP